VFIDENSNHTDLEFSIDLISSITETENSEGILTRFSSGFEQEHKKLINNRKIKNRIK
jgi:hypothetical protein